MTRIVTLEELRTPPTPEERKAALAALELAKSVREELAAKRGGRPFPPSEDDLAELREERTRELP